MIALLSRDTWLTSKPDGSVGPRIATEWKWEQGGTVLRLTLRRDVYFHDGTQLTPDVAVQLLRATDTSQDNSSFLSAKSIEPVGIDQVVFTLREHNMFLLNDLAGLSVQKPDHPEIGTGPYRVVGRSGKDVALDAFDRYFRGKPPLAGIDVVNYLTQRNAWTALMRGEIDMLYEVSPESAEFVKGESTVRMYPFSRPYYIPLVFNVRHPILRNVEVRRAINEAIDKDALVRDGMRAQGTRADGPILPQHWAYEPPAHPFEFDPVSARARLDRAGFRLKPSPERRVPIRFAFKCLVFGNDSRFERLAVIAQKQLADVGIDMQLEPLPFDALTKRLQAGTFDAFLFELSGPRLSRVYDFWRYREGSLMNAGYRSVDAVLDRMRVSQSDEETKAAVADLLRVMHDDPPAVFIAWQKTYRAVSTRFDVAAEPDRDILSKLWMWRPAAPQQASR